MLYSALSCALATALTPASARSARSDDRFSIKTWAPRAAQNSAKRRPAPEVHTGDADHLAIESRGQSPLQILEPTAGLQFRFHDLASALWLFHRAVRALAARTLRR